MSVKWLKVLRLDVLLVLSFLDVVLLKHSVSDQITVCYIVKNCVSEYLKFLVASQQAIAIFKLSVSECFKQNVLVCETVVKNLFNSRTHLLNQSQPQLSASQTFQVNSTLQILEFLAKQMGLFVKAKYRFDPCLLFSAHLLNIPILLVQCLYIVSECEIEVIKSIVHLKD